MNGSSRKLLGKDDCASHLSASSPKIVKWYAFTEVEKEALRVSWQPILANLEEFGVEIYEMIFEQCPEARTLFPFMMVERETERGNKKRNSEFVFQALRFVQILETGITSLDDLSSMNLLLHNLGKRHGKLSSSECFRPYYWSVFLECAIHKLRKYIMRKCRRLFGGAPLDRDQVDRVIILWRHLLYGIIIRIEIGFDEDIANRKSSRQERGAGDSSQKWKYSDMTRESWKKTNNTSVIENSLQNLKPFKSMSNTNLCNASRSRSRDWFK